MTLSGAICGKTRHEHRGQDGEVLRHVVGDAERGQRAAGHQQLLADLDDLDELGRVAVEVHHVAGFARRLRAGVHRHADIGLRQRRRVVGAVAGHGDELALRPARRGCSRSFVSGVASARKSSTPASAAMAAAVSGLSPVIMTVRMPIGAEAREALLDAALDHVLQMDDAEHPRAVGHDQRRAARARDRGSTMPSTLGGTSPPSARDVTPRSASAAPLRIRAAVEVARRSCASAREKGTNCAPSVAPARGRAGRTAPWPGRRSSGPRASRRPGTPAARRRRARSAATPGAGTNSVAMRLPSVMVPVLSSSSMSTSPAASTARPLIAMTLCWMQRGPCPAMPMADSRPPMVVGIRQTSSATMHRHGAGPSPE